MIGNFKSGIDIQVKSYVETPSGKDASYENFPVGSLLISAKLRSHVKTFYHFARVIDDIADDPDLHPEEKIRRLIGFEDAIEGNNSADTAYLSGHRMRVSLLDTNIAPQHCLDLIKAFKQDAEKDRYNSWGELVRYCQLSAAPVGRYLLDLHKAPIDAYEASDCLCIALQILNHIQDCKEDFIALNRVYIPNDNFSDEISVDDLLKAQHSSPELRKTLDLMLDKTKDLLDKARYLPFQLESQRLAMESQVIIYIADCLVNKLKKKDPLSIKVKLSKFQYLMCFILGVSGVLFNKVKYS